MKKKLLSVTAVLLMIAALFISCSNEVPDGNREAKVLFTSDTGMARGLDSSSPLFDVDQLYWTYEASKIDNSGLKTGETSGPAAVSKSGQLGLGETVGPFSLGVWKFTLQAHEGSATGNVLYIGTASNVIIAAGAANKVNVKVHALQEGNGRIEVLDDISLNDAHGNSILNYDEIITITSVSDPSNIKEYENSAARVFDVAAGSWKVNVAYVSKDDPSIVYGSNSIYVTVFANQTVTVSGSLEEITSDTIFETTVDGGTKAISTPVAVTAAAPSKLEVESSPSAAQSVTEKTTVDIPANALKADGEAKLSVTSYDSPVASKVFTVADGKGAAVAALDINLTVNDQTVNDFNGQEVTVSTYIAKGLAVKPTVVYNGGGDDMQPDQESVTYDSASGLLTFKTKHFSQYYIVADVVAMNATTGKYYSKIEDFNEEVKQVSGLTCAFFDAEPGDRIVMLDDVNFANGDYDYLQVFKKIEFDMNSHAITSSHPYYVFYIGDTGELVIDNGRIEMTSTSAQDIFYIVGGKLVINGGVYSAGAVGSAKKEAVIACWNGGSVVVNGGELDGLSADYCFTTNGTAGQRNTITVNDGTLKGTCYFPSEGALTINNGTFTNSAECVYVKGGNLAIWNGSFTATGDGSAAGKWTHNGSGTTQQGSAIVIEGCDYPAGEPTVTIVDGSFNGFSDKDYGILVIDWRKSESDTVHSVDRTDIRVPYAYVDLVGTQEHALDSSNVQLFENGESYLHVSAAVAESGNGTRKAPLKTINEALANPDTEVIYVGEGTYVEDIVISESRKVSIVGIGTSVTNGAVKGVDLAKSSDLTKASRLKGTVTVGKNADVVLDNLVIERDDASSTLIHSNAPAFTLLIKDSVMLPARNGRPSFIVSENPTSADVINYTLDGTCVEMIGNMGYRGNNGFRFDGDVNRHAAVEERPTLNLKLNDSSIVSSEKSNIYPISMSRVGVVNIDMINSMISSEGNHYSIWYWDCGIAGKDSKLNVQSSLLKGWCPLYISNSRDVKAVIKDSDLIGFNINDGTRDDFSTITLEGCDDTVVDVVDSTVGFTRYGKAEQGLCSIVKSDVTSEPTGCIIRFTRCNAEWERKIEPDKVKGCVLIQYAGNNVYADDASISSILGNEFEMDQYGSLVNKLQL